MTEDRKDLSTSAWGALLQVHAAVVPVLDHKLMAEAGMPLRFYDVLLELAAAPERKLRMTELADRVVLSRTRVSRLVDEMVSAGLLVREQNPARRPVGVRRAHRPRARALPQGRADVPRRHRAALRSALRIGSSRRSPPPCSASCRRHREPSGKTKAAGGSFQAYPPASAIGARTAA